MKPTLRGFALASLAALALCVGCSGSERVYLSLGGSDGDPEPPPPVASVPSPIEVRAARLGAENVLVVWDKWANGDPPGGFVVKRRGPGEAGWTEVARTGAATIHWLDEELAPGQYSYKIGAVDGDGLVAYGQPVDFTLDHDPQPARPTRFKGYSSGQGEIHLKWDDNSDNETGFLIGQVSTSYWYWNAQFTPLASLPANTTEYTLTGLTPHTYYYLAVKAVNGAAQSEPTEILNIRVRATPNFVEYKLLNPNSDTNRTRYTYDERGLLCDVGYEINTSGVFRTTQTYGGPWGRLTGYYQGNTYVPVEITDTPYGETLTRRDGGVLIANYVYNDDGDMILSESYTLSPDRTYSTLSSRVTRIPNRYGLEERSPSYINGTGTESYTSYIYDDRLRHIGSEGRVVGQGGGVLVSYANYTYGQTHLSTSRDQAGGQSRTDGYTVPDGTGTREVAYWTDNTTQTTGRYVTAYDASHAMTYRLVDANRDGNPEERSRTTYFENGSIASYFFFQDQDSDGLHDYTLKETCTTGGECRITENYGDGSEPPVDY